MAVLVIAGSCASGKKAYVVKDNEEFFGTWVNENSPISIEKLVFNPDGTVMAYANVSITVGYEGTYEITDKWSDSSGNIFYRFYWIIPVHRPRKNGLARISDSGETLEMNFYPEGLPEEIDPNSYIGEYRIYYRQ
jgi:hypothetical protein